MEDTMNKGEDKVFKRQKRAMQYKRDVATGKQKLYWSKDKARRQNLLREQKVARAREFLMASNQMHLEGAVTAMIRELPKGSVIKDPLIRSYISYCRRKYKHKKLLAAAHASDATAAATVSSTVKSNEDTRTPSEDTPSTLSTGTGTSAQPDSVAEAARARQDGPNQSDDADAPALITPHKPEDDASGVENEKQSNDGSSALDDDDDCIYCHDDDSIDEKLIDNNSNGVGLGSSSNSKPAALVAPKEEGQPCFVLIRNNFSPKQLSSSNLYWPALLYESRDALQSNFPFRNNQDRLSVQVECGKNEHACGIGNYSAGEVKVAILLGNDVPPSLTRSVPVPVSHAFGTMRYHCVYTKKKANGLRKWKGYADNYKFLEALGMLERYVVLKDSNILSMMKYT